MQTKENIQLEQTRKIIRNILKHAELKDTELYAHVKKIAKICL